MREIQIDVEGDDARTLFQWLARTPELRGHLMERRQPAPEGTLGVGDWVIVVTATGPTLIAFSRALFSYLTERERQRRERFTCTIKKEDGTSVQLGAEGPRSSAALSDLLGQNGVTGVHMSIEHGRTLQAGPAADAH